MKTNRLFKFITAMVFVLGLMFMPATDIPVLQNFVITASAEPPIVDSGTCDYGLSWKLYDDEYYTVVLSGSGRMRSFDDIGNSYDRRPWRGWYPYPKKVVVEDGVLEIGKNAFNGFNAIETAEISATVDMIGRSVFEGTNMKEVIFEGNPTTIDGAQYVFGATLSKPVKLIAKGAAGTLKAYYDKYPTYFTLWVRLSLDANGGTLSDAYIDVTYGGAATLPTPSKSGYIFDGWWTAASGGTQVTNTTTHTAGKTLYAHWKPNNYTITYNANGGTGTMTVGSATPGTAFTLPANGFTAPTGKKFKCWAIGSTGGTQKNAGATHTFTADTTVYAVWDNCSYTVTLNKNSGTINAGNITSYTYGTGATLPTDVTRTGYNFGGWFDNSGCTGTAVTAIPTNATGNKTFWAKWTPATYTVTLNTNSGTINSGNVAGYTYGTGATLPTDVTRTGYTFGGWFDNSGCMGTAVTTISSTATGDKTFWAKWTANTYTVTLTTNSGTINSGNVTSYTYGTGVTLPTNVTRTGYTFGGWYTASNFSGSAVTAIGTAETGNKTFYAKWTANTYTVTLNKNDGTINAGNITSYTYGIGATLPTDVTKTKYTFGGWYDNDACTGSVVTAISTTDTGDKTFYARWEENRMSDSVVNLSDKTVTYNGSAQSLAPINTLDATIKYGTTEGTYDLNSIPSYTDAGTYTIYYKATKDNYFDKTGSATLTINPQKLTKPTAGNTDKTYSGIPQGPTIEGYDSSTMTQAGTANATDKGDYSITWSLKDTHNYRWSDDSTAEVTVSWKINAKPITNSDIGITLSENEYIYDGTNKNPKVTVADSGGGTSTTLASGTDYTCSYEHNKNSGTATVTIEGIGNYTGTTSKEFAIKKQEVNIPGAGTSADIILLPSSYEYNGNYCNPGVEVIDNNGKTIPTEEYTITYKDNLNVGTATVDITNKDGGNYIVSGYKTFEITAATISASDITVAAIEDKTYTGSEIKPEITLKYGDKVIPAAEYEISYSDNTNVGTATITIENKEGGNYIISGTVTKTFEIVAEAITGISAEGYEVTYDGENHSITVTGTVDGDKIEYSTDGTNYDGTKPVFKDAGEYTVYYKVKRSNHHDFTGTATVKINKKDVTIFGIMAEDKTYDGTNRASVIGTPVINGLLALDEDKVSAVGTAAFENKNAGDNKTVIFTGFTLTGEKAGNYNLTAQPASVTANISKAPVRITWKDEPFTYNGKPQKPEPDSISGVFGNDSCSIAVSVSGEHTNAGTDYTATASLTGDDKDNYYISSSGTEHFTITQKALTGDMVTLDGTDNTYFFTGNAITPAVTVSDDDAHITSDDYTIGGIESATAFGSYNLTVTGKGNYTSEVTVTWYIKDPNPPAGNIAVSTNSWNTFHNGITFDLFYNKAQTVTISGEDGSGESGVDKIYYYLSQTELLPESVAQVADWTELSTTGNVRKTGSFRITPDNKYIIYAKITDNSGNVKYINSNGIVLDVAKPEITGIENGKTYCEEQTVTVTDEYLKEVTVNGTKQTITGNSCTAKLEATDKNYTIVATDKAGNSTTVKATVKNGHKYATAVRENYKPATCTTDGSYDLVERCLVCEHIKCTEKITEPAKGHDYETVTVQASGCQSSGFEKKTCRICGHVETVGLEETGHQYDTEFTIDKEATCAEEGSKSRHCLKCDAVTDVTVIEKTDTHTEVTDAAVPATCTETGLTEGSHCSVCYKVIKAQERVSALSHTGGEATCCDRAVCTRCHQPYGDVDTNAHQWNSYYTVDVEATCTETGIESRHCARCGARDDENVIPAKGHSWENSDTGDGWVDISSPDCGNSGSRKRTCTVCGYIETDIVDPSGHDWVTEHREATCTEDGIEYKQCSRCSAVTDVTIISKKGHTEVTDVAVSPTCTEAGKIEGKHCSECNAVLTAQMTIPALGHNYGEWVSCNSEKHQKVCTACGDTWEAAHVMGSWAPTGDTGKMRHECVFCGYGEDRSEYTVTLNTRGGTIGSGAVTRYTCGKGAILPTDVTRTGYTFGGWYKNSGCSGTAVTAISDTDTGNKTFYAKWESISYTINYELNGGSASGNPANYTIESETFTLISPVKDGYTFTGWSGTGLTGKNNMSVSIAKGSTGDRSYTANWVCAAHHFGEWAEVKTPKCTEKGSRKRSCTVCGYTETEDVDAIGHNYSSSWSKDAVGHWKECTRCRAKDQTISHSYDNDKDATCNICGYTRSIVPEHTHSGTRVSAKAATCTEDGNKAYYTCTCGKWFSDSGCTSEITNKDSVKIAALGHSWKNSYTTDKAATCTEDGSKSVHCSRCDATKDSTIIPVTGHKYDNDSDATCNVCGYTRTVEKSNNDNSGNTVQTPTNQDKPVNSNNKDKPTSNTGNSDNKNVQKEKPKSDKTNKQTGNKDKQQNNDKQAILVEKEGETPVITGEKTVTGSVLEADSKETTLDVGKGNVVVTVNCEDEGYTAGVVDTVAVANAVLTPEQIQRAYNGETVEIRVDEKDISENMPESEKEAMKKFIERQHEIPDLQIGKYIDISIYVRTKNGEWEAVTQTREPIDVVIGISEDLKGEGRDFYVVRLHEGGITLLYDRDNSDDTITVRSSQFSEYAIAYTEAGAGTDIQTDTEAYTRADAQTDEETNIAADIGIDTMAIEQALHSDDDKCSLCHICPTFLGLCCFIWLAIAIVVVTAFVIAYVVIMKRRKDR